MHDPSLPGRHAPLFDRPLSASMGRAVLDHLAALTPLPASGCVAGQSVMSALLALYPSEAHRGHAGPIKDVDVFHGAQDRLIESGFFEELALLDGAGLVPVSPLNDAQAKPGDYDRLFDFKLNIERVHLSGLLNLIEMAPSLPLGGDAATMSDADRLDTVLSEFDFSLVQVGVDLKTGALRWTPGFAAVARGEPVRVDDIGLAERTWMRYQKKRAQMPWLSWDDAQIKSAVQLAQIRTYALLGGDKSAPEKFAAWQAAPSMERLPELPENARLSPIWDWLACRDRSASFQEVKRMHGAGQFALTPRDALLLESFTAVFAPCRDPNTLSIDMPTHDALRVAKDGLSNLVRNGDDQALRRYLQAGGSLLDGASPADFRRGRRPELIHEAIRWGKLHTVAMLLDAGFSPNDREAPLGATAYLQLLIHMPSANGSSLQDLSIQLLERMRQMGADVTLPFGPDSTMWHEAARKVDARWMALEMPHHGAHRSLTNAWGRWPSEGMDTATEYKDCQRGAVAALFKATPEERHVMALTESLMAGCLSGDLPAVRAALAAGASANRGNSVCPLFAAAYKGHADVVQALLVAGADTGIKEEGGRTPLIIAAMHGHGGAIQALLSAGARIDEADRRGSTALAHAALRGHAQVVSALAQQGASANPVLGNGCRLIEVAASSHGPDMPSVVTVLAQHLRAQLDGPAAQAILGRARERAVQFSVSDHVAVLDSALAMAHMDALLEPRQPALRRAA